MVLAKKPVTGMRDITPAEMQIREYMMNQIKETYRSLGFAQMETPCVEYVGNLTNKQDGDNEKLTLKIPKGGDKLNLEEAKEENDLVDSGLCYDLILSLSYYHANNAANPLSPFKALQVGSVWRTDRPQKGRSHQFVQCDIDILGDATSLVEIELILAITTALGRICPDNGFTVCINDKDTLRGMALYYGFPEEPMDQVFITLDRMDKIGYEGVERELLGSSYCPESVNKCLDMLKNVVKDSAEVRVPGQMLSEAIPTNISEGLAHIVDTVAEVAETGFGLEFDPMLVGGMSYYTETIFEVFMEGFGGSVAGGGRYDKMVGEFTGTETPACGLPMGFECIVTIPMGNGFTVPGVSASKAFLSEKGVDSVRLAAVICETMEERKRGVRVPAAQMNKNKKFQREQLGREGYMESRKFYKESLKN